MNGRIAAIAAIIIIALPIGAGYLLNIESSEQTVYTEDKTVNITDYLLNDTIDYTVKMTDSSVNSLFLNDGDLWHNASYKVISTTVTSMPWDGQGFTGTVTVSESWQQILNGPVIQAVATIPGGHEVDIRFTYFDGSTKSVSASTVSDLKITRLYDVVSFNGDLYKNVSKIEIKSSDSFTFNYHREPVSGAVSFVDPVYGWGVLNGVKWITTSDIIYSSVWTINFDDTYRTITIGPESGEKLTIRSIFGDIYVGDDSLGKYHFIRVIFGYDKYVVYGVPGDSWPAMGADIAPIKVLEYDYPGQLPYSSIDLANGATYRVDSADVFAGSTPSITDNEFNIGDVMPGTDSYKVTIKNVGPVGDSINFAGTNYPVVNGKLQILTRQYELNGLTFRSEKHDDTWYNYIGKTKVNDTAAVPTVEFVGDWFATVSLNALEASTVTAQEWVPGHFGLDMSDACLIGAVGCLAAFVGLAMYGRRSGAKIGPLILVCGLGAIIFLIMI